MRKLPTASAKLVGRKLLGFNPKSGKSQVVQRSSGTKLACKDGPVRTGIRQSS